MRRAPGSDNPAGRDAGRMVLHAGGGRGAPARAMKRGSRGAGCNACMDAQQRLKLGLLRAFAAREVEFAFPPRPGPHALPRSTP